MKDTLILGIKLALYATAACFALALVNHVTAPEIAKHQQAKENSALKTIFPDADGFEEITGFDAKSSRDKIESFYKVTQKGDIAGYVIKSTGNTYETSTLVSGFSPDMTIVGVQVLATSDSPGFGQKAADANYKNSKGTTFYGQFAGVNASAKLGLGVDFEAISGATITSATMGEMISNAASLVQTYIQQSGE